MRWWEVVGGSEAKGASAKRVHRAQIAKADSAVARPRALLRPPLLLVAMAIDLPSLLRISPLLRARSVVALEC